MRRCPRAKTSRHGSESVGFSAFAPVISSSLLSESAYTSQMLTLFSTPVVYLMFDRIQWWLMKPKKIGAELEELEAREATIS